MRTPFLFALMFVGVTVFAEDVTSVTVQRQNVPTRNRMVRKTVMITRTRVVLLPPPVAGGPALPATPVTVEGVLPHLLAARNPAQMLNPLAPPEYGRGSDYVVYTDYDPYRTDNENKRRFQTDGIRLLTIRPLW